jgi:enterochelin esterase-like enzyme
VPPLPTIQASGGPVLSNARPWLAWRPSGSGSVTQLALPGGWTGGSRPDAELSVYLPPGYTAGSRRYPVTYELPFGLPLWQSSIRVTGLFDALIDSGAMPPQIVVFVSPFGGPYPDSECVDSADGREWFERWFTGSIVPAIDHRFRTIATPAARALLGYSQGGYCAAMLLLRHPDVVSNAVAISGYYESGIRSAQTPNAWRPFGTDAALIAATSPVTAAAAVPAAVRSELFVVLCGDPKEAFYGAQYRAFGAALAKAGIASALLPNAGGHAWPAVRSVLPIALRTLAAREAAAGVFHG